MQRTCLIFNAKASAAGNLKPLLERFAAEVHGELCVTRHADDARQFARRAAAAGFERIVVAGGDGTISQVINGLEPDFSRLDVAIVPSGTGNDLARSLGIPTDRPDVALSLARQGRAAAVDLVRVFDGSTSFLINAATGGLGGKVAADLEHADKLRWGAFAYWITAVRELAELQAMQLMLTLDGNSSQFDVYGVAIANGRYVGGGFPIAPQAYLNDGLLDVTVIPVLPTLDLLAAGLESMLSLPPGKHRVQSFQARRVSISTSPAMPFSMDGEPTQQLDAQFELLPAALRVVAAAKAPGIRTTSKQPLPYANSAGDRSDSRVLNRGSLRPSMAAPLPGQTAVQGVSGGVTLV